MRRPSPAMVVACVALVVALGGTGYAATKLPPDSVGRIQIREGAVGTAQVRDNSLRRKDFAPGTLPKAQASTVRQAGGDPVPAGTVGAVSVACNPGERMMGGGGGFAGDPTTNDKLVDSIPVAFDKPPGRWRVSLFNGGVQARTPVAYVICAAP